MAKPKTLHLRAKDITWPSTWYLGATTVKFLCTKRGRRIKIEHRGHAKPRIKRLQIERRRGNNSPG